MIVQLGIYKARPEWLKPDAKKKIDKMVKEQAKHQMSNIDQKPILLAAAEMLSPTGEPILSDATANLGVFTVAQAAPLVVREIVVLALPALIAKMTSDAAKNTIAQIQLSAPTLAQSNEQLQASVANELDTMKAEQCKLGACQTVTIPQEQLILKKGEGQGNMGCDEPPNPPMYCYRLDNNPNGTSAYCSDTGKKSKTHYNLYERNYAGNGKCYWNPSQFHAICERKNIPNPSAPCASFPSFR